MNNKMDSYIMENPEKISNDLIDRARKLSSSLISDAMSPIGTMDFEIKPLRQSILMVGTALTVKLNPGDNLFLHKAISLSEPGYVLVVDSSGNKKSAMWGELMTKTAIAVGIEGVVLDGVVRDVNFLRKAELPIFTRGAIPNGTTRNNLGIINTQITCGDVPVNPGDMIIGDDDGVVVIPFNMIDEILTKAEKRSMLEDERILDIKNGKLLPQWVEDNISILLR